MPEIVPDEGILGGEPHIEGARIGVLDVYELSVGAGHAPADAADQLDVSLAVVYAALSYYYDDTAEMRELEGDRDSLHESLADDALQSPESAQ